MAHARPFVCFLFALVAALATAVAQDDGIRYFHPEKFERATKTDEAGMVQWADHAQLKCPTCSGTGQMKCSTCARYPDEAKKCPDCKRAEDKKAPCHACAGTGTFPDPLEKALCPGCRGAGYLLCGCCPGSGILKVGDDKRWSACPGCRGEGAVVCNVCAGKRLVEVAALKPSLRDANAAALKKAMESTDKLLADLAAFAPTAKNSRKESKALAEIIQSTGPLYPALKRVPKALDEVMKRTYPGANFQGQAQREVDSMGRIRSNVEYYVKHQRRMLELAQKRAEANEKLAAENKDK